MEPSRRLLKPAIAGVLWLGLCVGCKQAPQSADYQTGQKAKTVLNGPVAPTTNINTCDDGTCCGKKGGYYKYHETFSGDTVILRGNSIEFRKPIPTNPTQVRAVNAEVCPLTATPVNKLIYEVFGTANYDDPIKCRIWGRLYTGDKEKYAAGEGPTRYFAVDYVEAIK